MSTEAKQNPSHIVVVVGVDLSDVSEHLLRRARDLVRSVDEAVLHVVHVVQPESLRDRLVQPVHSAGIGTRAHTEFAHWALVRLCDAIVKGSGARLVLHTPVGHAPDVLNRIAREVGADVIVVEAHDHRRRPRIFRHSVVARIAQIAPCSVLTIRTPQPRVPHEAAAPRLDVEAAPAARAG